MARITSCAGSTPDAHATVERSLVSANTGAGFPCRQVTIEDAREFLDPGPKQLVKAERELT